MSETLHVDFSREFADNDNARIHRQLLMLANAISHLDEAGCKVIGVENSTLGLRPTVEVKLPSHSEFERIARVCKSMLFNGRAHITMGFDYHGIRVEYQIVRDVEQVMA